MSRSLIVLPDETAKPILDAIDAARESLRIKMFEFSDPSVMKAVTGAHQRGVNVRIMLNPARRSGEAENEETRKQLADAGIEVIDSNPAFDLTHEKSMVVDDHTAWIGSVNWEPENFTSTRDYSVMTTQAEEVAEVIEGFDADWSRTTFTPREHSNLIWCPGGREPIARFIDGAKHSLYVQNERYHDAIIVEHLVRAKLRGVKVHVMARPSQSMRPDKFVEGIGDLRIMQDVGIGIRKVRRLKLHAKVLLADKARAIVGSINFSPGSFDTRRELAIRVEDEEVVDRLLKVLRKDWKNGHPFDLSETAVHKEMKKFAGRTTS